MAKRAVHDMFGVGAGAIFAVYRAGDQPSANVVLEGIGGILGGLAGSRLPDIFDPPTSPNHRGLAHGVLTTSGGTYVIWEWLKQLQDWLRTQADELAAERQGQLTDAERLWNQLLEWLYRMIAGAIMGLVAGYTSHLALDFTTRKGLPLVA